MLINSFKRPFTALPNTNRELSSRKGLKTAKIRAPTKDKKPDEDLDLIYLLMKNAPDKYELDKINEKFKTINNFYSDKIENNKMNKVDSTFYKYNILYGTNSVNLIKAYSQKLRPNSAAIRSIQINHSDNVDYNCFTEDEIRILFLAKCADLNIKSKQNLEQKFRDYCSLKCINRNVDFNECNLNINSSKVLSYIISNNDKIARLNISKNALGDKGISILMEGISNNQSIVHLDISSNDLTYKGGFYVFSALENNQSIVSLNIGSKEGLNRNRLTVDGIIHLEQVLKVNKFLQFLDLSGNSLKNDGLLIILRGLNENKTIHSLNIANNEINHMGINFFKRVQNCKLVNLNINDNPLGNEGIAIIAECLNKPVFISLKKLEVQHCKFDYSGFIKIFEYLQGNKRLEILQCSNNNFKSKEDFKVIKSAFSNLYLKELHLSNCKLGNLATKVIAEGLLTNNTIQKINLQDNGIDDRGFAYFTDVPLKNNSIQILDLSKNQISDYSATPFVKNLYKNVALKQINFFDNQLKNETGSNLIEVLRTNITLSKINLKFNGIQIRTLDEIERQIKTNKEVLKVKKIPNLRKEIRSTYVTDQDFEIVDNKIKEAALNYQNLSEKLKEEVDRFELMKKEEEVKVKIVINDNDDVVKQVIEKEEELRGVKKELLIENEYYFKLIEKESNEINEINNEIEELASKLKDLKKDCDKKAIIWKEDLKKITSEHYNTSNTLKATQKGYESLKKDLDIKLQIIDRAENPIETKSDANPNEEVKKDSPKKLPSRQPSSIGIKKKISQLNIDEKVISDKAAKGNNIKEKNKKSKSKNKKPNI